jgi:uncharacterized protein (TIGR01440 family)
MFNLDDEITAKINSALAELLHIANLKPKQILVVGCSSSEIQGKRIGSCSSIEIGKGVFAGLIHLLQTNGLFLAVQCCEHLNRCLVVEKECAELYNLEIVNVVPALKAGGSLATTAYTEFKEPVVVERISAHAGMDIGDTFIGMHLRPVAVPVRPQVKSIGEANLTMARTRPKLIGGERAKYL